MKAARYGAVINRGLVVGFLVLFAVMPCAGRLITVDDDGPANFNTIQAAIDDVNSEGTVIVVAPGVYQENVEFCDRDILLTSSNPNKEEVIKATVIDGGGSGPAVSFSWFDTPGSELRGFSITGGDNRAGIEGNHASGTISKCIIRDNPGSGIMMWRGRTDNCLIVSNGDYGIYSETATIVNTTIAGNTSGGLWGYGSNVQNCIVWGNGEPQIIFEGIIFGRGGGGLSYPSSVLYSCVQGGYEGEGNIGVLPRFADVNGGDYRLTAGSACIDAGQATWPEPLAVTDLAGRPRQRDGDGDGQVVVDMGCYEYGIVTTPLILAQPTQPIFTSVEGGANPDSQNIYISNVGIGTLNWEIQESCSWLGVSPSSGICEDEVNEAVLSVDISGLAIGRHVCELSVVDSAASNSPVTVMVNCVILNQATINVPFDYPTIQQAVDAAGDGDTVVIAPGTYKGEGNRSINLYEKMITVRSAEPSDLAIVAGTIIDCERMGNGFRASYSEDANRALEGLTIINGAFGGIYWEGRGRISRCVIMNCYNAEGPPSGGGISVWGDLPIPTPGPVISGCIIANNRSYECGGGIHCKESYATIEDCEIIGNYAQQSGGGIHSEGDPIIRRCVIRDNRAGSAASHDGGGGICCLRGSAYITDCIIENNRAFMGGGIATPRYLYGGRGGRRGSPPLPPQKTVISNCTVRANVATIRGAGILCAEYGGADYITDCKIYGNTLAQRGSEGDGGGAFCEGYSEASFSNCMFSGNRATQGGGLYSENHYRRQPRITNCTFSGNYALDKGGGVWGLWPSIANSIFWGNTAGAADVLDSQVVLEEAEDDKEIQFSCIQDEYAYDDDVPFGGADSNNIDDDPMFVRDPDDGGDGWGDDSETSEVDEGANDDYGDLHLRKCSPCINAGPAGWASEPNSVDMDGQERIIGPAVDMGADEYSPMIVVSRPQTGEVWLAKRTYEIEWKSWGVDAVDILLSKNGGGQWELIAGDVNDTGSYLWDVPGGKDSNECMISVTGSGGESDVVTVPSGLFSIGKYPHRVLAPPGLVRRRRPLRPVYGPELACVKWTFETAGPVSSAAAILAGNTGRYNVYITCEDGELYVLDSTGELVWNYDAGSPIVGSPAIGHFGLVILAAENGRVYAVDKRRGLRWTYSTDGPIYSTPVVGPDWRVYVCSEDGTMHALGLDGTELWTFKTQGSAEQSGAIYATPVIGDDGTVYIAGRYDPNLYALEPNDGSVKWACNFEAEPNPLLPPDKPCWPVAGPAVGQNGTLYQVLVDDSLLYAIDANDGNVLWAKNMIPSSYDVNYAGSGGWSSPALGPDGSIYVSFDDPYLRAVEPNGAIKWITKLGDVGGFTLTVDSAGYIYAAGDDGYLSVISPDGNELSRFEGNGYLSHPVLAPDGTLIVSDANNRVWALNAEACDGQPLDLHRPADINGDGVFNFTDFALITTQWRAGKNRSLRTADVNRDSHISRADLTALAEQWMREE